MYMSELIALARANLLRKGYIIASGYRIQTEVERIWRQKGKPQIVWTV